MPKDILVLGSIGEYNVLYFFEQITKALEAEPEAELTVRLNVTGGNPDYGMSFVEKVREMSDRILIKANSQVHSFGLFALAFMDKDRVECIDMTRGVLHRAAYPDWIESAPWFEGSPHQELIVKMNKDLEKAFRAKVNVDELEALPQFKEKNLKLKDIFSMESRKEVILNAKDLKKLGLVGKINTMIPSKSAEIKTLTESFSKCRSLEEYRMAASSTNQNENPPVMETITADELKSKFPSIYAQVIAEGEKKGLEKEQKRVKALLAWAKIDPAAVAKAVADGTEPDMAFISEMSAKAASDTSLKRIKKQNAPDVETEEVEAPTSEKKAELNKLEADVRGMLGMKPKAKAVIRKEKQEEEVTEE